MNDALYEHLVARKPRPHDLIIRIVAVLFVAAVVIIGFPLIGTFSVIIALILGFLVYTFLFRRLNVEYEYTVLNHDMDVDVIYSREKRKKVLNFDLQQAEIIAPKGSPRLRSYNPQVTHDYTSQEANAKAYAIMMPMDGKNVCILIEPDEGLIQHIKPWMGSKLYLD